MKKKDNPNDATLGRLLFSRAHSVAPGVQIASGWAELGFGFLLASLVFSVAYIFSTLNVDVHHQGIMYSAALKVLDGARLYGDASYYYGPLVPGVNAFGLLLFGRELVVIQAMASVVYGLTSVVLWRIWRRYLPSGLAFASVLFAFLLAPFWYWEFHPWSSLYSLLFLASSLLFLLRWLERGAAIDLILSGLLATLSFWARQSVGIPVIACGILALVLVSFIRKTPRTFLGRQVVLFGGTVGVVFALGLGILQLNHSVKAWFMDCFVSRVVWAGGLAGDGSFLSVLGSVFASLFDGYSGSLWMLLPLLTVVLLVGVGLGLVVSRSGADTERRIGIVVFLLFALATWFQYYPVSDPRHHFWSALLFMAVPPIAVLSIIFPGRRLFVATHRWMQPILLGVNVVILAVCGIMVVEYGVEVKRRFITGFTNDPTLHLDPAFTRLEKYNTPFVQPPVLVGMRGSPDQVAALARLGKQIAQLKADVPSRGLVNTSGWDKLAGAYADTDRISGSAQTDPSLPAVLVGDNSNPPSGYFEVEHEVIRPGFAYQATNPGHYYLFAVPPPSSLKEPK